LADIETHLDGIRLIPLTFRTASANNKVFAAAAALLASHRALEAELRDTIDAEEFNLLEFEAVRKERDALKAELAQARELAHEMEQTAHEYEDAALDCAACKQVATQPDLAAEVARLGERVEALEGQRLATENGDYYEISGSMDSVSSVRVGGLDGDWMHLMRPRQNGGDHE